MKPRRPTDPARDACLCWAALLACMTVFLIVNWAAITDTEAEADTQASLRDAIAQARQDHATRHAQEPRHAHAQQK